MLHKLHSKHTSPAGLILDFKKIYDRKWLSLGLLNVMKLHRVRVEGSLSVTASVGAKQVGRAAHMNDSPVQFLRSSFCDDGNNPGMTSPLWPGAKRS